MAHPSSDPTADAPRDGSVVELLVPLDVAPSPPAQAWIDGRWHDQPAPPGWPAAAPCGYWAPADDADAQLNDPVGWRTPAPALAAA